MKRKPLRRKCFERDNFICQKCKTEDKTGKILEAHHKTPIVFGGEDELINLITLCFDCHHFVPNKKEELEEYLDSELDGMTTTLIRAWKKVKEESFKDKLKNKGWIKE